MEQSSTPTPEFNLGSARGRKAKADLIFTIVRSLTEDDLPKLTTPSALGSAPIPIQTLRSSHHQLAQLLVQGRPDTEVSLITGYSATRISILKKDPAFAELMAGYQNVREKTFVDTLERMKLLGLNTLDELQERLETDPQRWSNRELMEMADLMLVRPKIATPIGQASAGTASGTNSGGVNVLVQFVKSETPQLVIEGKAENVPQAERERDSRNRGRI
jgi:hypothetical protein